MSKLSLRNQNISDDLKLVKSYLDNLVEFYTKVSLKFWIESQIFQQQLQTIVLTLK